MACVYVYGFAPGTQETDFLNEFFADFDQHEMVQRVDFKGDKIMAFIHVNTEKQAQDLIDNWNGQKMSNSKFGLQVRMKGQNNHIKPREPNLFVYGFPKTMTQQEFQEEFFLKFPEVWESCLKVDFLAEKLQAFIHCAETDHCDKLVTHWDGRPMQNSGKPLQVRYKGDNLENNRMNKMAPVIYVYGFPKGMTEEDFRAEFFGPNQHYEQKIDFHANKLYSFVHCHNPQQCQELITMWNGKKMAESIKPLQVSMRDMHQPKNQMGFGMNQAMGMGGMMGGMMGNGGPRARFMNPQMNMMVPGQYAPMMVPQMQQGYGMNPMAWGGMHMAAQYQQMQGGFQGQQGMHGNNKRQMPNGNMMQNGGQTFSNGAPGLMQFNNQNGMNVRPGPGPMNKRPKMNGMKMENGMNNMNGQNFRGQNPNQFSQGDGNYSNDQQAQSWM